MYYSQDRESCTVNGNRELFSLSSNEAKINLKNGFSCVGSEKINWGEIKPRKHQGVDEQCIKLSKYSMIMHVLTRLWTEWKMQIEILQDSISSAGLNSTMS